MGGRGEDEEEEIGREELGKIVRRLRDGKAAGGDGISNEVWKYGGVEVERCLWELCNKVWKGGGGPGGWNEGVVIPIRKKGEGDKVEEYRWITLSQTAYKIYATVLAERLRAETDEKDILPPSQAGFRKGMGTMDNIYVLNYLINRQLEKKGGSLVLLFVDMKAAFDSVDRGILVRAMR